MASFWKDLHLILQLKVFSLVLEIRKRASGPVKVDVQLGNGRCAKVLAKPDVRWTQSTVLWQSGVTFRLLRTSKNVSLPKKISQQTRDDSHLSSPLLWRINGPALSYSLYLDNGFNGSCPMGFIHCDKSRGCGLFRVQVARLLWVRSSCGRHWTVVLFMSEFCYIFNMHNRTEELIRLKLHMQPSAHAASKDTD